MFCQFNVNSLLKNRYLKNVFPKVDETVLLDMLEQSDNNVQKASEKLIELGYEKKNPTGPSKNASSKPKEEKVEIFFFSSLLINDSRFIFFFPICCCYPGGNSSTNTDATATNEELRGEEQK